VRRTLELFAIDRLATCSVSAGEVSSLDHELQRNIMTKNIHQLPHRRSEKRGKGWGEREDTALDEEREEQHDDLRQE
jgi:hypothetical protein